MNRSVVVVELSGAVLTLVEVKGGPRQAALQRYLVRRLPENGVTADFISQLWREEKVLSSRIICTFSNRLIKFKTLTLPVLPDNQLQNAIRLELESSGSNDCIYHIFSKTIRERMVTVKVALVRNKDLTAVVRPFQDAGLTVLWLGYYCRGIQNFINFHRGFFHDDYEAAGYLIFFENGAEFGVVTDETILYRRDLEINISDFQEPRPAAEVDLIDELRLSNAAFQAGVGKTPPKILWLFGKNNKALSHIHDRLAKEGYQICRSEKAHLTGAASETETPALAALLGLALDELGWDSVAGLRIQTLEQQEKAGIRERLKLAVKFALAGGILAGGLLLLFQARLVKRDKEARWLAAQSGKIARLRQIEAKTSQYLAKIKTMENWMDSRGRELEFLVALHQGVPEDTIITDLNMEDGQVRNISGITPSVSLLLDRLQKSPALRSLKLKGNIAVTENGLERFQLEDPTKQKETK